MRTVQEGDTALSIWYCVLTSSAQRVRKALYKCPVWHNML